MIKISSLKVNLGSFSIENIDLEIQNREYFIILGPTGAGKSVLLEALAGLHPLIEGKIEVNGRDITYFPPERRKIGIVYQDYSLFPHMSVYGNIAYGLKMKKNTEKSIKTKVVSIAEATGISDLLIRMPKTLSGGERQRVALARSLVTEPDVLLLDEPMNALDPNNREKMRAFLKEIHEKFKITVIHVTHDFEEAMVLGENVAVLNKGVLVQTGSPQEIMRHPKTEFVADFALSRNIFKGKVENTENGYSIVDVGGARMIVVTEKEGEINCSIRPEEIIISREKIHSTARNCLEGIIGEISNRGFYVLVKVFAGQEFICMVTISALEELALSKGQTVWIIFKASAVNVF